MSAQTIHLSDHARDQASRRGLDEALVMEIARAPSQVIPVRNGREIRQSQAKLGNKRYIVRVVVDLGGTADHVVTVYRSSKIDKYWRQT